MVSEITGTRALCSVQRSGKSQYEICYQPTIKGRLQLHIIAEGQYIRGSPCIITAKSPVEQLGTPILAIGGIDEPQGITISQKGELVVAEGSQGCLSFFSIKGEKFAHVAKLVLVMVSLIFLVE